MIIVWVCVLLSHSASGWVRISKPNMTFCSYLNCYYYSWRRMMSFPIRPRPLRKQPVVWCYPTKAAFLLLSYVCVSLCVHALYSFLFVYEMSHQRWTRGSLLLSQRLFFRSHSLTWHPRAWWPQWSPCSLRQAHRRGQILCCPGAEERNGCKSVNVMLYLDA